MNVPLFVCLAVIIQSSLCIENMVGRCIVYGCSNTVQDRTISLHYWPKDAKSSRLWRLFIMHKRAKWSGPTENSQVCSAHFTPDQFTNYKKFRMGFVKKLTLKDKAIPTIQAGTCQIRTRDIPVSARTAPPSRTAYQKINKADEVIILQLLTLNDERSSKHLIHPCN